MRYLVDSHQTQIASGLAPEQVKFTTSLPALRDASVAGVVEVYDFMTGPTGRELIKKVKCSFCFSLLHLYFHNRHGKIAPPMDGTSLVNVLPARKLNPHSTTTYVNIQICTTRLRTGLVWSMA